MKTLGDFLRRVVAGGAWTDDEIADVYLLADRLDNDGKDTPDEAKQVGRVDDAPFVVGGPSGSTEQSGTPDAPPES